MEVVPGFYDMEKRKTQEKEEDEKIKEEKKKNYQDEAPQEDQPEPKKEEEKEPINPIWFIIPGILLLIALYEVLDVYKRQVHVRIPMENKNGN